MARRILIYLAMMAGVVFFAGLFAVVFGNSTEVSCLRAAAENPTCRITRALLGRFPISTRTVRDIVDVELERDCDDGCTYRALLVSSDGKSGPVDFVSTDNFDAVQQQIEGIGGFLAGSGSSYHLEVPVAWWVLWLVCGMTAVGALVLAANFLMESRGR